MDATAMVSREEKPVSTRKSKGSMDAIVTARVPVEVKEQVNDILKEIGATPTELINAAYRYVLKHGSLPEEKLPFGERVRKLSETDKQNIRALIERTTFEAPASWKNKSFEELREEAMRERYSEYFCERG